MTYNFQLLYDTTIKKSIYEDYIKLLKPYIDSDTIVIDCGCGSGILASYVEKRTPHVFAFDMDPKMIELAKQKTIHTTYQVLDMHTPWPFFGDVIVMSMDVINFTDSPFVVLKHAIDALNETGVMCLDMYLDDIDLNYHETSLEPFEYTWTLSHEKHVIHHRIVSASFDISMKQYVHNIKDIKSYMEDQGFQVELKTALDPRKIILICKR
jgi:trans-aconitate methyltransferase